MSRMSGSFLFSSACRAASKTRSTGSRSSGSRCFSTSANIGLGNVLGNNKKANGNSNSNSNSNNSDSDGKHTATNNTKNGGMFWKQVGSSGSSAGVGRPYRSSFSTVGFKAATTASAPANANASTSTNINANANIRFKSTAATATATSTYAQKIDAFPSIVIGPDRTIEPQGSFAEAQAQFLDPDPEAVEALRQGLLDTNMGIVAHYYMDVELQGVLQALRATPGLEHRVGIADSLKMGDLAVDMCHDHGVESVICLGVDFMAESVQAILHKNACGHIPVYRATAEHIGCSLAESAEGTAYRAWLQHESGSTPAATSPAASATSVRSGSTTSAAAAAAASHTTTPTTEAALHVIYINTSLETKAVSSSIVPTITCTSSNVLQTLLQASAQLTEEGVPDLKILYGPDTYMGHNLQTLLEALLESAEWTDAKIQSDLHPSHTNASLQRLRDHLVVFPQGNCVVHHMFGNEVVQTVRDDYDDCFMTAHLEVPGEMFALAMEKSLDDRGVVGSTSDILTFISRKVQEAATSTTTATATATVTPHRLRFVLGTEAGMVTSIVQSVQRILEESGGAHIEAEVIFPVSQEAVMSTSPEEAEASGMALVPGVSGGEGCSTAGGCATCPFMKMNDLDRVGDLIELVRVVMGDDDDDGGGGGVDSATASATLATHLPPNRLQGRQLNGRDAVDLGSEAILYMRHLMQHKALPDELIQNIIRNNHSKSD